MNAVFASLLLLIYLLSAYYVLFRIQMQWVKAPSNKKIRQGTIGIQFIKVLKFPTAGPVTGR